VAGGLWLTVNDWADEGRAWLRLWENAVPISEQAEVATVRA